MLHKDRDSSSAPPGQKLSWPETLAQDRQGPSGRNADRAKKIPVQLLHLGVLATAFCLLPPLPRTLASDVGVSGPSGTVETPTHPKFETEKYKDLLHSQCPQVRRRVTSRVRASTLVLMANPTFPGDSAGLRQPSARGQAGTEPD